MDGKTETKLVFIVYHDKTLYLFIMFTRSACSARGEEGFSVNYQGYTCSVDL